MKNKGFTLMELMVVVVIIGIIAGFSLPQYQKAVRKSHERDAVIQLTSLNAANTMYRAINDAYLDDGGGTLGLAAINAGLNINIIANDMTYSYDRTSATAYTATATWDEAGTANDFTVEIDQGPVDNNNPYCGAGSCPSLP